MMAEPWERLPTDTTKSFEAFQVYRDMGKDRSLMKVAAELSKSYTILSRWSAKHNWVERIQAWEAEQDRLIRIELAKDIGAMRKRHVSMAKAMLLKAGKALERIPIDEIKASDISKLVESATKLERISRGDVGEVVEERTTTEAVDPVQFYLPSNGRDTNDE